MLESLRPWVLSQAVLTLILVFALRVLQTYMRHQEFFAWWTKAWASFGVWLVLGWAQVEFRDAPPGMLYVLVLVGTFGGYLQALAFVNGARTLRTKAGSYHEVTSVALVGAVAIISVVIAGAMQDPLIAFAVRNLPRQMLLIFACVYSAVEVCRWTRQESTAAAIIISLGCIGYAWIQCWSVLNYLGLTLPGVAAAQTYQFFLFSYACQAAMIVGMMLLVLQRNRLAQQRLKLYEAILPTCCVCGVIRDDTELANLPGEWLNLHDYVGRHANARFSHTFCPTCLVEYRRRQGLPAITGDAA